MATKTDDPILRELVLEYCQEQGRATLNATGMPVGRDWTLTLGEFNVTANEYHLKAWFKEPPPERGLRYSKSWYFKARVCRKTGKILHIRV